MLKKIINAIFGTLLTVLTFGLIAYCASMSVQAYEFQAAGVVNGSCAETPFVHERGETPRIASDLYVYSDEYATKRIGRIEQFHFFKVIDRSGEMVKVVKYHERELEASSSYWVKRDSLQIARHIVCKL